MSQPIPSRTVAMLVVVVLLLASSWAAAEPPATRQLGSAQSAQAGDPGALRVSQTVRPTFRILSRHPGYTEPIYIGPDLVPVAPRIGTYVVGHVMVSGKAVDAWEIYWRVKNQGGQPVTANTTVRASCTPMNVSPTLPPPVKVWINALMCEWLNTGENVPAPVNPGAVVEARSYLTYPSNVPCTAPHPKVTFTVDPQNTVNEGPREGNNELTVEFCQ